MSQTIIFLSSFLELSNRATSLSHRNFLFLHSLCTFSLYILIHLLCPLSRFISYSIFSTFLFHFLSISLPTLSFHFPLHIISTSSLRYLWNFSVYFLMPLSHPTFSFYFSLNFFSPFLSQLLLSTFPLKFFYLLSHHTFLLHFLYFVTLLSLSIFSFYFFH